MFRDRYRKAELIFGLILAVFSASIPTTPVVALCFLLCSAAVILDFRYFRPFVQFLGVAIVVLALAHVREQQLTAIAFGMAGMIFVLKNRISKSAAILVLQYFWFVLVLIALVGLVGSVLNKVEDIPIFSETLGGDLWLMMGLLVLSGALFYAMRRHPGFHAFYKNRQDRQLAALSVMLFVSFGVISGMTGAGILGSHAAREEQRAIVDAAHANSINIIDTLRHATVQAGKISEFIGSPGAGIPTHAKLVKMIEMYRAEGIQAISILGMDGRPVTSAGEFPGLDAERIELAGAQPAWLFWQNGLHLESVVPIHLGRQATGKVVMSINLSDLDAELNLAQGIGRTGELVICKGDNAGMVCLPSHLHPGYGHYPERYQGHILPMSYALKGGSGAVMDVDYRGQMVLAAYRPLTQFGLGMVQKIDVEELYARSRDQMLFSFFLFLILASAGGWGVFHKLRPVIRKLRYSEGESRAILDNLQEAVVMIDEQGSIRSRNFAAHDLFGGRCAVGSLIFPILREYPWCFEKSSVGGADCKRVNCNGIPEFNRCSGIAGNAVRPDGSTFPYEMSVGSFDFERKKYFVCIVRDITERKQSIELLQERERYIGNLLESLQTAVLVHDTDGRINYLNTAASRFFRSHPAELLGNRVADKVQCFRNEDGSIIPEESLPLNRIYSTGKSLYNHVLGVEFPGEEVMRWILLNATPDLDECGFIKEVFVSFVDITERKQSQEMLVATSAQLSKLSRLYLVLSQVNAATIRVRNRDYLFSDICRILVTSGGFRMAWIGLWDEQKADVIPTVCYGNESGYLDVLKQTGLMAHNGFVSLMMRTGEPQVCMDVATDPKMATWREEALKRGYRSSAGFSITLKGKRIGAINVYADEPQYFSVDIVNFLTEIGESVSFSIDYLDQQSKRENAEAMLKQVNAELEHRVQSRTRQLEVANAELEAFSYSVSHDLRAPLRSIYGFSDLLLKHHASQLDEKGADYLERVKRSAKRMGELIVDLLELSRVSRSEINREEVDLSRLAMEVIEERYVSEPADRWEVQPGMCVMADRRLMKIALENLIGNACKFSSTRQNAKIEFGVLRHKNEQVMYVRDNGVGFDMKYVNKLFGAFQRLHRSDEFEGTGIGLATVQRIIHKHGGEIWAEGKVGTGATFYFSL